MPSIAIGKARWAALLTFLALWPAWIRQVKFGMQSFPAGLAMFVVLVGWWAIEQRRIASKENGTGAFAYAAWVLLILYAVLLGRIPPLAGQILATTTFSCALLAAIPRRIVAGRIANLALFPLTLPLEMALQFVFGYPFRRISAVTAGALLSPYGVAVKGTTLMYTTHPLEVDAACSGVLGLWAFLIVGAILSLVLRHHCRRLILNLSIATVASIGYNVLRTSMLFIYRFHEGAESMTMHSGIGAVAYLIAVALFLIVASRESLFPPALGRKERTA